jgi:hypothetical protein
MVTMMEATTISVDKKTLDKLTVIAQKSSLTKTVLITAYIDALYRLITEARPDSEKISLTNFELDLKLGVIKQGYANLFDIGELPHFIQDFYACLKRIEDLEMSKQSISKEILLKEGFSEIDIDVLLKERKK